MAVLTLGRLASSWILPFDLSGPEDQLHLEGRVDHGAQGSREHQQCQGHPISMSRERGIRRGGKEGLTPLGGAKSKGSTHSRSFSSRNSIRSRVTLKKETVIIK